MARLLIAATLLLVLSAGPLTAQTDSVLTRLPLEELKYPPTTLCLLDARGEQVSFPFDWQVFNNALLAWMRSADWLKVKTENEIANVLQRDRISVPHTYEPRTLDRIARLTDSDYVGYMRLIALDKDRHDGFTIPVLFHRNKVTYSAEMDVAVLNGEKGSLQYSEKVIGRQSVGKGFQIYPIVEDPALHLSFRDKDDLARNMMEDLAHRTFEALMRGIKKEMSRKYICYWRDEVHIIADKAGLCPICGSRLVEIYR